MKSKGDLLLKLVIEAYLKVFFHLEVLLKYRHFFSLRLKVSIVKDWNAFLVNKRGLFIVADASLRGSGYPLSLVGSC
jgi:hypothetical protein